MIQVQADTYTWIMVMIHPVDAMIDPVRVSIIIVVVGGMTMMFMTMPGAPGMLVTMFIMTIVILMAMLLVSIFLAVSIMTVSDMLELVSFMLLD